MKNVILGVLALGLSTHAFGATLLNSSSYAFDFAAPIVNNSTNYTNSLPYGSIVYDASADEFKGLNRSGSWDTLTIPGSNPNVTSTSTGKEHIERATITPTSSSTCIVNAQSGSWITSITANAVGDCSLNVSSSEWSSWANVSCTVSVQDGNGPTTSAAFAKVDLGTTNVVRIKSAYMLSGSTSLTANASPVYVVCMGQQ